MVLYLGVPGLRVRELRVEALAEQVLRAATPGRSRQAPPEIRAMLARLALMETPALQEIREAQETPAARGPMVTPAQQVPQARGQLPAVREAPAGLALTVTRELRAVPELGRLRELQATPEIRPRQPTLTHPL